MDVSMWRCVALVSVGVLAVHSRPVDADDFKDAVDAAYCFGVDQSDIEHMLRLTNKADTSDLVRKNSERSALIGRAISGRQIDAVLVQKMKSKGYLEASLCFKKADECAFAYARLSKQQRDQCESAKDELCKPVFACEDQEDKEEERRQLDDYYSRER